MVFFRSFARFCLVGILSTGIHYAILFLLVRALDLNEELATSCGFTVSTAVNYLLNRSFTFDSSRAHRSSLPRFLIMILIGLGLNAGSLSVAYRLIGLSLFLAQVLATGLVLAWNFSGSCW